MREVTKKIKMTFKQMREMNGAFSILEHKNPLIAETKFGYAFKRFFEKNIAHVFKEYNMKLSIIRIESALTDEKTKAVLTSDDAQKGGRGFQYNKEGLKDVMVAESKLEENWDSKEYDVEPFISKDVPKLNESEIEVFKGFII